MRSGGREFPQKTELLTRHKREVALKYLELARSEIQDKINFVNTTLGGYLIGTSAIAAWFYQIYKPADELSAAAMPLHEQRVAVGLTIIFSYLALGVSWIINHNERMVTALALYQRNDLLPILGEEPPMWESSSCLLERDNPRRAVTMIAVQQMIIVAPPISVLVFVCARLAALPPSLLAATGVAAAATALVIVIAISTAVDRWRARRHKRAECGVV